MTVSSASSFSKTTTITEDMLSDEERFIMGSITHLGPVTITRCKHKGTFIHDYQCKLGDMKTPRYGPTVCNVLHQMRDAAYGLLWFECEVV